MRFFSLDSFGSSLDDPTHTPDAYASGCKKQKNGVFAMACYLHIIKTNQTAHIQGYL